MVDFRDKDAREVLHKLGNSGLPCVPVKIHDAADCPRNDVILVPAVVAFENVPAQHSRCSSERRWHVAVGSGQLRTVRLEPSRFYQILNLQ